MKISKIFHTLYGFLMCLPIISILFVCVYVSVNPNAKDSYSGTEIQYRQVEYQTNEVNSLDDLVVGNLYNFHFYAIDGTWEDYFTDIVEVENIKLYSIYNLDYINDFYVDDYYIHNFNSLPSFFVTYFDFSNLNLFLNLFDYDLSTDYYIGFVLDFSGVSLPYNQDLYFVIEMTDDFYNLLIQHNVGNTKQEFFSSADLSVLPPQYEEVEVQKLDNAFYYSVNEINDNPLFSWAQNSFLVAPITYVVSLFGMINNSPIVTMLSYWLTISIIWLVFDLIMYIPLLVHRWIDKGVVE